MKYCYGVDIGGTTVKLGLFSEAGAIVEKWEIVTRTEDEGSAILPDIAEPLTIPSTVTGAGTPTPIPRTCSFSMPCCSNLPLIASAISGRTDRTDSRIWK